LIHSIIERGANVFARDNGGMTAYYKAVSKRDSAILKLLVDAGASPDVYDVQGEKTLPQAI